MARPLYRLLMLLCVIVALARPVSTLPHAMGATTATKVSIAGSQFLINGQVPAAGTSAQGLLLNSRMIQGIFDDENPQTVGNWAYPDTHVWDPQRNTTELVAALPSYAQHGLRLITVGLQGGCPRCDSTNGQNITTAYNADGSLKAAWMSRLDQVLRAADRAGLVVLVSLFYYKQDYRLASAPAVQTALNNVTDWLVAGGYTNVLVEIANECNIGNFYPLLACDPTALAQVQQRSGGRLLVGTSYTGGALPSAAVVSQADFVTLHGNGQSAGGVSSMVSQVRAMAAYQAKPKPVIFNEDSTSVANLNAAVGAGASWGYYDQGSNDYWDGYQAPPVNWTINTSSKQAFFNQVAALTSSAAPTPSTTATPVATTPLPSGWSSADIGSPSPPGSQALNGGTWTVQSAGADIWGTADQFHFVWQTLSGDGSLSAHVTAQTNTSSYAKAGVMLRASTDPGAAYYAAYVTPGGGIRVEYRPSQGASALSLANPSGAAPVYLQVSRTGSTYTAYTSSDGVTWTAVAGTSVALSLPSTVLAGLAVTSNAPGTLGTATFDSVDPGPNPGASATATPRATAQRTSTSAPTRTPSPTGTSTAVPPPTSTRTPAGTAPPTRTSTARPIATSTSVPATATARPATCPTPWTCADIGSPVPAGGQTLAASTWTVSGAGADIWGTADQFHFVWQTFSGDGSLSAHVTAQTNTSSYAKAGVMLRASTDPGAAYYYAFVTPGGGIRVEDRPSQGASALMLANPWGSVPTYLKVARSGNTFTAYTSSDGATWAAVSGSTATITTTAAILGGMAVTSHAAGSLGTAAFDTVLDPSGPAGAPTSSPVPPPATATPAGRTVTTTPLPATATQRPAGTTTPPPATATSSAGASAGLTVVGNHLQDSSGKTVRLLGVDESGTQYMCIQGGTTGNVGRGIFDWSSNTIAQIVAGMKTWAITAVRVPLNEDCWLGINGVNPAYGGATYQQAISSFVTALRQAGLYVILDLHWNAPGTDVAQAQQPMADADHAPAFWTSVATFFKGDTGVVFDLYNEPYAGSYQTPGQDPWACWLNGCTMTSYALGSGQQTSYVWQAAGMQSLVNAVRATGATNVVMTGGLSYADDESGWLAHEPVDPLHHLAASWHDYNAPPCNVQSCWDSIIAPLAAQVPVIIGETGDWNNQPVGYVPTALGWADQHGISYVGWQWQAIADPGNVLIASYDGTPAPNYGLWMYNHFKALAGAPTATAAPTATSIPATCPAPWTCADIGSPSPPGSQALNGGTWTVQSAGADIWGTADQFHFVWQTLSGDGSLSAHVTAQTNTSSYAKAGVMLRASTDPGAAYYAAYVTPGGGIRVEYRPSQGASALSLANPSGAAPVYLQVSRTGSTYTAYTSPDGVTWTAVAGTSVALSLPSTVLAGLAVTSNAPGTLGTATFDSVDPGPNPGASATATPKATTGTPGPAGTNTPAPPSTTPAPAATANVYTGPVPADPQWLNPHIVAYRSDGGDPTQFLNEGNPSCSYPCTVSFDLSGVASAQRQRVRLFYNAQATNVQYDTNNGGAGCYTSYYGVPGTFTIQTNTAPGGAVPTTGWSPVITASNQTLSELTYHLSLAGANWVRMAATAKSPCENQNRLGGNFDFYNDNAAADAGAAFMGDSIILLSGGHLAGSDTHNSYWSQALYNKVGQYAQQVNDGVGGTTAARCTSPDLSRDIAASPGKFYIIAFGTNDANGASSPANWQGFHDNLKACIDGVLAAGKIPVIGTIYWTSVANYNPWIPHLNDEIRTLYSEYPTQLLAGPDFYTYFYQHQSLLRDPSPTSGDVHPNGPGMQAIQLLWENWFLQQIYKLPASSLYPDPNG